MKFTPGDLVRVYAHNMVPIKMTETQTFFPGSLQSVGLLLSLAEGSLADFCDYPITANDFYTQRTVKFAYVLVADTIIKVAIDCLEIDQSL